MYTDRSSVQLWDSRSGALKAELNATQVLDLAFSPDAKILATLSYGGVVQLWDVGTAAEVTKLHQPDGYGGSLAFDPDGRLLAVGGVTNIVVWDLAQKTKMALLAVNSAGESAGVAFAHDGRTLFCGGPTIQFWDVTTRQVRATISTESWVRHLELSPDDRLLATEGSDRKIAIWDVRSGQKIVSLNGSGVTFSPDGGSVVLKGAAGVQLWRVKPAEEKRAWKVRADGRAFGIEHRFRDYRDAVLRVVYSSDGRILASTDSERTDLWDAETGGLIRSFYDPLEASTCLARCLPWQGSGRQGKRTAG